MEKSNLPSFDQLRQQLAENLQVYSDPKAYSKQLTATAQGASSKVRSQDDLLKLDNRVDIASATDNQIQQNEYENYGKFEMFTDTVGGFTRNLVGGFVREMGSLLSLPDQIRGDYSGNWLMDVGDWISTDKAILSNPYDDDWYSASSIANFVQNTGSNIGVLLEMGAEQALLSLATGASGGGAAGIQAAALASKVARFGKWLNTGLAIYQGAREAYTNSVDLYKEVKSTLMANGISEEEATQRAQQAASESYKKSAAVSIGVNVLTLGASKMLAGANKALRASASDVTRHAIVGGVDEAIGMMAEPLINKIGNKWVQKGANVAVNALGEGIDEGYQTYFTAYSRYNTLSDYGLEQVKNREVGDEMMTAAIQGAVSGGLVIPGMTGAVNRLRRGGQEKIDLKAEFLKNATEQTIKDMTEIQTIMNKPNPTKEELRHAQDLTFQLQTKQIRNAIQADAGTDGDDAVTHLFNSYDTAIKGIEEGNEDIMKQWGVTADNKNDMLQQIKDLKQIATQYNDTFVKSYKLFQNYELADHMANLFSTSNHYTNQAEQHRKDVISLISQNPLYANNPRARQVLDLASMDEWLNGQDPDNDEKKNFIKQLEEKRDALKNQLQDGEGKWLNQEDDDLYKMFNEQVGNKDSIASIFGWGISSDRLGHLSMNEYNKLNGDGKARRQFFDDIKTRRKEAKEQAKRVKEQAKINTQIDNINLETIDRTTYGDYAKLVEAYEKQNRFKKLNKERRAKVEAIKARIQQAIADEKHVNGQQDPFDVMAQEQEQQGSQGGASVRDIGSRFENQERQFVAGADGQVQEQTKQTRQQQGRPKQQKVKDTTPFDAGLSNSDRQPTENVSTGERVQDPSVQQSTDTDVQNTTGDPSALFLNVGNKKPVNRSEVKKAVQPYVDTLAQIQEDTQIKVLDGDENQGTVYTSEGSFVYNREPDGSYNVYRTSQNINDEETLAQLEKQASEKQKDRVAQNNLQNLAQKQVYESEAREDVKNEMLDNQVQEGLAKFFNVAPGTQLTDQQKQDLEKIVNIAITATAVLNGVPENQVSLEMIGRYLFDSMNPNQVSNMIGLVSKGIAQKFNMNEGQVINVLATSALTRGAESMSGVSTTTEATNQPRTQISFGPTNPNGSKGSPNTITTGVGVVNHIPGEYVEGQYKWDDNKAMIELNPETDFLDRASILLPGGVKPGSKVIFKVLDPNTDSELYERVKNYYAKDGEVTSDNVPIIAYSVGEDGRADKPIFIVPATEYVVDGLNDANKDRPSVNAYIQAVRDHIRDNNVTELQGQIQSIGPGANTNVSEISQDDTYKFVRTTLHDNVDYYVVTGYNRDVMKNGKSYNMVHTVTNLKTGERVDLPTPIEFESSLPIFPGDIIEEVRDNTGNKRHSKVYPLGFNTGGRKGEVGAHVAGQTQGGPNVQHLHNEYHQTMERHMKRMKQYHEILQLHMMVGSLYHYFKQNPGVSDYYHNMSYQEKFVTLLAMLSRDQVRINGTLVDIPMTIQNAAKRYAEYVAKHGVIPNEVLKETAYLFHQNVGFASNTRYGNTLDIQFDKDGTLINFRLTTDNPKTKTVGLYNSTEVRNNTERFYETSNPDVHRTIFQQMVRDYDQVQEDIDGLYRGTNNEKRNIFNIPKLSDASGKSRSMMDFDTEGNFTGVSEFTSEHLGRYGLITGNDAMYTVQDKEGKDQGVKFVNPSIQFSADDVQPSQVTPRAQTPVQLGQTNNSPTNSQPSAQTLLGNGDVTSQVKPTPTQDLGTAPTPDTDTQTKDEGETDTKEETTGKVVATTKLQTIEQTLNKLEKRKLGTTKLASVLRKIKNAHKKKHHNVGIRGNNEVQLTEEDVQALKDSQNMATGIPVEAFNYLVHQYMHRVLSEFKGDKTSIDFATRNRIEQEFIEDIQKYVQETVDELAEALTGEVGSELKDDIQEAFDETVHTLNAITEPDNIKAIRTTVDEFLRDKFGIKGEAVWMEEEQRWAFQQEALELDPKMSIPNILRVFLSDIKSDKTGFLGMTNYLDFNTAYRHMMSLFIGKNGPIRNDKNALLTRLYEKSKLHPWLVDVIQEGLGYKILETENGVVFEENNVTDAQDQLMNQMLHQFTQVPLEVRQVMYEQAGNFGSSVIDANAQEPKFTLRKNICETVLASRFITQSLSGKQITIGWNRDSVESVFSSDEYRKLLSEYSDKNDDVEMAKQISEFFREFGIEVDHRFFLYSDDTFTKSGKEGARDLFKKLAKQVKETLNGHQVETTVDEEQLKKFPFGKSEYKGSRTIAFLEQQAEITPELQVMFIRDGGKKIYTVTRSTHSDQFNMDNSDGSLYEKTKNDPYAGNTFLAQMYRAGGYGIAENTQVVTIPLTAIKEQGSNSSDQDRDFVSISDVDKQVTGLSMYFAEKQVGNPGWDNERKVFNGLTFRYATFLYPNMSDKTTMKAMFMPSVDTLGNDMNIIGFDSTTNKVTVNIKGNPNFQKFVLDNLYRNELSRMTRVLTGDDYSEVVADTTISTRMFVDHPFLNTVKVDGKTIQQHILDGTYEQNAQAIEDAVTDAFNEYYTQEIEYTLRDWVDGGIIKDYHKEGTNLAYELALLDHNRTNKHRTKADVGKLAFDYMFNTQLSKVMQATYISGDPALYGHDGKMSKRLKLDKKMLSNPDTEARNRAVVDALANADQETIYATVDELKTNRNKRLADLIAPGMQIADSENDSYLYLPLEDVETVDRAIETKIRLEYPQNLEAFRQAVNGLEVGSPEWEAKVREFFDKHPMPQIEAYLNNPATDAQEYTTVNEHLHVLYKKGRINKETHDRLKKIYQEGGEFSPEDLKTIMQPEKPVYVGFRDVNGVRVLTYIKSASIPLLPQSTKGTQLDKLRVAMEELERRTGKNVRAAHHSATKTGDVTPNKRLSMSNLNNMSSEDIVNNMSMNTVELSRNGFYIQMNVPYDHSHVSLGTQMMKLLFGSGIAHIEDSIFNYQGKSHTGSELLAKYNELFKTIQQKKRKEFFRSLGVGDDGRIKNSKEYVSKLAKMLQEEAQSRGWSSDEIKGLEPVNNRLYKSKRWGFKVPLWSGPNSEKYESLLNSVLDKKLMKMQLPGTSYVVGSEHGIGWSSEANLDEGVRSRVIYTGSFNGKYLEPAQFEEYTNDKGETRTRVKKTQVFVTSKLRGPDGKLIDLYEKDAYGKYIYLEEKDGRLHLNKDKIDPALLSMTSFRIPTSGHMSMSNVEVVGILPPEAGDLMIVPANFTTQKGLDFDIDKEYSYQYHSYIDDDGVVRKLVRDPKKKYDEKTEQKLLENELIEMHEAILASSDERVQRLINKVLSFEFTKKTRDILSPRGEFRSMHSDAYNFEQTELGKIGQIGIGVYSNAVTFQGLLEQQELKKGSAGQRFDYTIDIIGNDGKARTMRLPGVRGDIHLALGRSTTLNLDGSRQAYTRPVSEVLGELQNTATDNAKEMIMGLMNVTSDTIGVHTIMTLLGMDSVSIRTKDGAVENIHYPYLLLSQPIIREFAKKMSRNKSQFSQSMSVNDIITQLRLQYMEGIDLDNMGDHNDIQAMYNDSINPSDKSDLEFRKRQLQVLKAFEELHTLASQVRKVQTALSVHGKGLGSTSFESQAQFDGIRSLVELEPMMPGISRLIGKMTNEKPKGLSFQLNSDTWIVPDTPVGVAVVSALEATKIWKPYFIQYDDTVREVVDMVVSNSKWANSANKEDARRDVFREMRKYFLTMYNTHLYSSNIDYDRAELLLDRYEDETKKAVNYSLAKYFSFYVKSHPDLQDNALVRHLVPHSPKQQGGINELRLTFSLIEKDSSDMLTRSFIDLVERDLPLPDRNGKPYTTRDLARDLVRYAMITGGSNTAFSFTRYIPTEYLEILGFNEGLRALTPSGGDRSDVFSNSVFRTEEKREAFMVQFFRNNPSACRKINITGEHADKSFQLNMSDRTITYKGTQNYTPPFAVSFYVNDKQYVATRIKDTDTYVIHDTLGTNMISEYSYGEPNPPSITSRVFMSQIEQREAPRVHKRWFTSPDKNSPKFTSAFDNLTKKGNVFNGIKDFADRFKKELGLNNNNKDVQALYQMVNNYTKLGGKDVQIKLVDEIDGNPNALASFEESDDDSTLGTITLSRALFSDNASVKDVIYNLQHEFVHALTVSEVRSAELDSQSGMVDLNEERSKAYSRLNRIRNFLYRTLHTSDEDGYYASMEQKNREYGLTNNYELLAEFFSNAQFRDMLKSIKYTGNMTDTKTMMLKTIKSLLNSHIRTLADQQAFESMLETEIDNFLTDMSEDLNQILENMDGEVNMLTIIDNLISNFMVESDVSMLIDEYNQAREILFEESQDIDMNPNDNTKERTQVEEKMSINDIFTCV